MCPGMLHLTFLYSVQRLHWIILKLPYYAKLVGWQPFRNVFIPLARGLFSFTIFQHTYLLSCRLQTDWLWGCLFTGFLQGWLCMGLLKFALYKLTDRWSSFLEYSLSSKVNTFSRRACVLFYGLLNKIFSHLLTHYPPPNLQPEIKRV